MSKDAFYFSHDANARNDPKILAMRSICGSEGYGWYWMLIELMREQENYCLSIAGKYDYNAIAMQLQCEPDAIKTFITDCINEFHLYETDGQLFWSDSLLRRMGKMNKLRDKRKLAAHKGAEARWSDAKRMPNACQTDAIDMPKHAKEKKTKEKKIETKSNKITDEHISIFNHWNQQEIIIHKNLTEEIKKAIEAALKKHSLEEILQSIANFSTAYKNEKYEMCSYKWGLVTFLKQKNALPHFLDDGEKWLSYLDWQKKKPAQQPKKQKCETTGQEYELFDARGERG